MISEAYSGIIISGARLEVRFDGFRRMHADSEPKEFRGETMLLDSNLFLYIIAWVLLLFIVYKYYIEPRMSTQNQRNTDIDLMIDESFLPLARDRFGHTALHYAAELGNEERCRALIAGGADVNAQGGGDWGTPLHWAMRSANYNVCALLVDNGADVNATCGGKHNGATPLDELDRCIKYGRNPDWHTWRAGCGIEGGLLPAYRKIEALLIEHGAKRNL